MSVGTTADFDVTRDELVDLALGLVGVTEVQQTDRTLANKVLNSMIRHMDARGDWLWAIDNTESSFTTVSGQQEYVTGTGASNIAVGISRLEYAGVYIGTQHEDLVILDKPESVRTYLRDESNGQPLACHLAKAKLLANNTLLLYPTPNAAYTIKYTYRRPLYDFDGATNNPDFPGEFILPLQKLLAVQLAPHYGLPLPERQQLMVEGERELEMAKAYHADRPSYQPLRTEFF